MVEEKVSGYGKLKRWVSQRIRIPLHNVFIGEDSGKITTGNYNNLIGYHSGYNNTTGHSNAFIGYAAGYSNTTGTVNSFIGCQAGFSNISGIQNVFIGAKAGYYETGHNKLFIDNTPRTNEADGRIKALIYGVFDPLTSNQLIRLNAIFQITAIKSGTSQANAGAVAHEVWKTLNATNGLPDNVLMIGV